MLWVMPIGGWYVVAILAAVFLENDESAKDFYVMSLIQFTVLKVGG